MQDRQNQFNYQSLRKRRRRLSIIAAGIFLVAVIGSVVFVLRLFRHYDQARPSVCTHTRTTVQPTQPVIHPGQSMGKIVYSTPICPVDGSYVFAPLTWSPDSKRLGIGTVNAQSWFATTGENVVNYGPSRNASVLAVVWSPDGQRIAVTAVSQGVQIFDASTGHLLNTYPDSSQSPSVLTTGRYLYANLELSGGSGAGATSWSPDGKLMATAFFGSFGRSVRVWDTRNGKLVLNYSGHADEVESISWSADGQYVASSSADGSTQVWYALTGQKIYDFESNQRGGSNVSWSPDSKTIAYFDGKQIRVVNPFTGNILVRHNGSDDVFTWSPDGKTIASAGDHIELWSVTTGKTYYTFTKNSSAISILAWSPDGNYIASADFPAPYSNSTVKVWIAK